MLGGMEKVAANAKHDSAIAHAPLELFALNPSDAILAQALA